MDAALGFQEDRDTLPRLCIVGCEERVEASTPGKGVTEDGVERLHDLRAGEKALSSLLRTGTAVGGAKPEGAGAAGSVMSMITLPSSASP